MPSRGYVPKLEVRYLFDKSWEIFKQHLGLVVGVFLVYVALGAGTSTLVGRGTMMGALVQVVEFLIQGPLTAGVCYVTLRLVRGEPAAFRQMFEGFQEFSRTFGVYVLYGFIVVVGTMLLVVPGLYAAIALMPAMYLVLDAHRDIIETLKQAWAMTDGYRGRLALVFLVLLGVNVAGALLLGVGIVVSGAFSLVVGAAVYNELARAY